MRPARRSNTHAAPEHPWHSHCPPQGSGSPTFLPTSRATAPPRGVRGRPGFVFLLLQLLILSQRLRWQREGILSVTGVRDAMEGAQLRLGVPWDPRAHEAVGLRGTAGFGCRSSLLAVIGSELQPGGYFWLCITATAHAAALLPLSPPHARSRARTPVCPPHPQTHTHSTLAPCPPPRAASWPPNPHQGSWQRCPVSKPHRGELPAPAGCCCTQGGVGLHFSPPQADGEELQRVLHSATLKFVSAHAHAEAGMSLG